MTHTEYVKTIKAMDFISFVKHMNAIRNQNPDQADKIWHEIFASEVQNG